MLSVHPTLHLQRTMEVALPIFAHLALFTLAFAAMGVGCFLLARQSGAKRFIAAPLLLVAGLWCLGRAIDRL